MKITEEQLFNQFNDTVGKTGNTYTLFMEAIRLGKWLDDNKENIEQEWFDTARFFVSALTKERRDNWLKELDK